MANWTSGYVTEIPYTHGYYRELSPALIDLALLNRQIRVPHGRPLRYLELGFGQGLSFAVHAAACPGEYWGTDFIPAQAANARQLAAAAGVEARILDLSFEELLARDDLPEFDIVALHGIWSWVSAENRALLVELLRRRLAIGGRLFISYNCTPGWSPFMPLRDLMTLHADLAGSAEAGLAANIDAAFDFAQRVAEADALYFRANPGLAERLTAFKGMDRHYLAHEYFNRDWAPMPFSRVAEALAGAKLAFAASASLLDHVDQLNFSGKGLELMAGIRHPVLRESARDFMLNQQFRKDIFVKGARPMPVGEQMERFAARRFVLTVRPEQVSLELVGAAGRIGLPAEVYRPLLDLLAEDGHAAKSVAALLGHPAWGGKPLALLSQVLIILVGAGHVQPVQDEDTIAAARPYCRALNAHLLERARHDGAVGFLASPTIGGGFPVNGIDQLFLLARRAGHRADAAAAGFVWDILRARGTALVRDGTVLTTAEANLAELANRARGFAEEQMPILSALEIVE